MVIQEIFPAGAKNFIPTVHHAAMCQAEGGKIIRSNVKNANIGGMGYPVKSLPVLKKIEDFIKNGDIWKNLVLISIILIQFMK